MDTFSNEQINIFQSLFRGREDVFAIRWKKLAKVVICRRTILAGMSSQKTN